MKFKVYMKNSILILLLILIVSCEDFVEIESPANKLVSAQVFNSDETAISAMNGIYNQLSMASFSDGYRNSVTFLSGLSADNLENISTTNLQRMEYQQNQLAPDNQLNLELWASAYNIIYLTNSFIEGLQVSDEISPELVAQLEGEAKFIRAFTYFYLVNLYGDVPLILTTNYQTNELASRNEVEEVYTQIEIDLLEAANLLNPEYREGERVAVNKYTVSAFLGRVYLYQKEWELAEKYSSEVIQQTSSYHIQEDLNSVFLANSKEAIWQISPMGRGGMTSHTNEGNLFIIDPVFTFFATVKLSDDFLNTFESEDRRLLEWVGYNSKREASFSYKYKIRNSSEFPIQEYSMVLRLAEQYLIRAEARVMQEDLSGAIADIDIIKMRAGLSLLSENNPDISKDELLMEIMKERRKELFAEWGHRWLDLKRNEIAGEILSKENPHWNNTDVLYPIPEEERKKNPNLTQNPGY